MLVLTRKVGERIQLGDNITVTLVNIHGNTVRLGIEAPPEMPVARQELIQRLADRDRPAHEPARSRVGCAHRANRLCRLYWPTFVGRVYLPTRIGCSSVARPFAMR